MEINEVISDIELALSISSNKRILQVCNKFLPDEDFGNELNDGIVNDMYYLIVDEIVESNEKAKDIYFYLLNEKITIDEDEFYLEEEINHG